MTGLLFRGAEVEGRIRDVRVAAGTVVAVAEELPPAPGEPVVRADGGALLPGLHDAHIHLLALAAAARSVACGPPAVADATALAAALAGSPGGPDGWVRGTGYVESVAGELDAEALDRLHARRPVRIQHRSGAWWTVNTGGARLLGLDTADHPGIERRADGSPTGRLWRADPWLRERLGPAPPPDLSDVAGRLARLGVTSVTDATPDLDGGTVELLATAHRTGTLPQRLELLGVALGPAPLPPSVSIGPCKIVLGDPYLPGLDELTARIRAAREVGRAVAVHCVTREALVLLLAALDEAGGAPGDRIEHAALVPAELVPELGRRGLRVVTQPGFVADRGDDFRRGVPASEHADLYRCRSLLDGGVPVALSSDAPYGPLDPWEVIGAAVDRRAPDGAALAPGEGVSAAQALAALLSAPGDPGGPPRRVRPGSAADLVLLDRPLAAQLAAPAADAVRTVLIGGRTVWPA